MTIDADATPISIMPALFQFTWINTLLTILAAVFFWFTDIEAPSAMGIITVTASLAPVGATFVKQAGRVMASGERALFATLATIILFAISLILIGGLLTYVGLPLSTNGLGQMFGFGNFEARIFAYILNGVALLYWLVIFFGMIWACRIGMKQLERQQK